MRIDPGLLADPGGGLGDIVLDPVEPDRPGGSQEVVGDLEGLAVLQGALAVPAQVHGQGGDSPRGGDSSGR